MAKVSFNKLGLAKNMDIKTINYNDQVIEVKQYLPIQEKLQLIQDIVNRAVDEGSFYNPGKVDLFTVLGIVEHYTNITTTPKQKNENFCNTYDLLVGSGLIDQIIEVIPEEELGDLIEFIEKSVKSIFKYRSSAMGILESMSQNYDALDFDATAIQQKLADPNNLNLLREIAPMLGLK